MRTFTPSFIIGAPLVASDAAGSAARSIATLGWFMLALATVCFVIVIAALLIGIRRRHDAAADIDGPPPLEPPPASAGSRRLMLWGGLVLPSVSVVAVLIGTLIVMRDTDPQRVEPTVTIEVTGHQWWWEVRYPDDDVVTANEIHIPVDEPVLLRLYSADVIHSFWVPDLAGKMDALPDHVNTLLIDANQPGQFDGQCAEFCGLQHTFMGVTVFAHNPADYEAWLADNRPSGSTTAGAGSDLYLQHCASCHVLGDGDVAQPAPNLANFSEREMIGGVLENTPTNLADWIADPHAYKEGVLMPALDLSEADIDAITEYVQGLRP